MKKQSQWGYQVRLTKGEEKVYAYASDMEEAFDKAQAQTGHSDLVGWRGRLREVIYRPGTTELIGYVEYRSRQPEDDPGTQEYRSFAAEHSQDGEGYLLSYADSTEQAEALVLSEYRRLGPFGQRENGGSEQ